MQVAIIAGGLATRLGPAAQQTPKSLISIAGKTFIEHQLGLLKNAGVKRVVICLGHLGDQVEKAVGNGARLGLTVQYSYDGDRLRGTGGALRRAVSLLDERFLVLYGDSYLTCDYAAVEQSFLASKKSGLMTVYRNDGRFDASNVDFRDGKIVRYEKGKQGMTHIDYGLGGLKRDALLEFPGDTRFDLAALYQSLIGNNDLAGYEVAERFYEIGSPAGLEETRRFLEKRS